MFDDFIASTQTGPYNNYGTAPSVPFAVNNVTIGPVALNDTNKGLIDKFWAAYVDVSDNIIIEDLELSSTTFILNEPDGVQNIALAFDQNANDTYAYITGIGDLKIRFFDASIPNDVILNIGQAQSVTFTMDMKYFPSNPRSDILLFYIRDNAIFYRIQRDKYSIEYTTPVTTGANQLIDSGMRTDYRFQVQYI